MSEKYANHNKGVRKGFGVKKTLQLDILRKRYYLRKGD